MIFFLYGKDTYRMREKLKEIVEKYRKIHKSGLNLKHFDCRKETSEDLFSSFKDELMQTSMFGEKKLAILTNPFSDAGFKEKFLASEKEFLKSDDLILFYQEGEASKSDSFFKFLKKNAKCQEFSLLGGQALKAWVKKEFEKHKAKIGIEVLEALCEYVGNDLWQMTNEIAKLAGYKSGKEIKKEDIDLLVRPKIETDIFKTIDAIADKSKKVALRLLNKHLEKGDSPLYLLAMINYQFRNLLIVKDFIERQKPYSFILKKSGLHPFVVKKSYYQSQKFTFQELKKIYQKIFQVDLDIKTGKMEPETALDMLITEI